MAPPPGVSPYAPKPVPAVPRPLVSPYAPLPPAKPALAAPVRPAAAPLTPVAAPAPEPRPKAAEVVRPVGGQLQPIGGQVEPAPPLGGAPAAPEAQSQRERIQLIPPGPDRLFRLESEAALKERLRQEAREFVPPERIVFPDNPVLSREPYFGRQWPVTARPVEPNYVCHRRLLFEEKNSERYGWELGFLQPLVSYGYFLKDVAFLPYHVGTAPCRCYECSAGLCLPGDPVPYLIYPPELSLTGAFTEAAIIATLFVVIP